MDNKELIQLLEDLDSAVEFDPGLQLQEKVKQAIHSLQSPSLPADPDYTGMLSPDALRSVADGLENGNSSAEELSRWWYEALQSQEAEPVGFVFTDDCGHTYGHLHHDCDLIDGASLYATHLPKAQIPEWVKCSERLPRDEDADVNGEVWESDGEEVWASHVHFRAIDAIYWTPTGLHKPKPPTEG